MCAHRVAHRVIAIYDRVFIDRTKIVLLQRMIEMSASVKAPTIKHTAAMLLDKALWATCLYLAERQLGLYTRDCILYRRRIESCVFPSVLTGPGSTQRCEGFSICESPQRDKRSL